MLNCALRDFSDFFGFVFWGVYVWKWRPPRSTYCKELLKFFDILWVKETTLHLHASLSLTEADTLFMVYTYNWYFLATHRLLDCSNSTNLWTKVNMADKQKSEWQWKCSCNIRRDSAKVWKFKQTLSVL